MQNRRYQRPESEKEQGRIFCDDRNIQNLVYDDDHMKVYDNDFPKWGIL